MSCILVVDDAAFSRRMICKYLKVDGYELLEAANGREALKMVHAHMPDCVLTDLLMPDINGFELIKMLQTEGITIPVIIISADIQASSREQGHQLGAVQFINKPPKEDELRAAVRQACGGGK
ncbi:MAG: response regulator [Chroococcidiopsidaceae cyanobacterium CP_BM_RX_35]|nr:response regulator [Chroococcidiopsidaceae cyanobacterium CP_BM_RX_35]